MAKDEHDLRPADVFCRMKQLAVALVWLPMLASVWGNSFFTLYHALTPGDA